MDYIRDMVRDNNFKVTFEFEQRMNQREFSLEEAKNAIYSRRIIREESSEGGLPK